MAQDCCTDDRALTVQRGKKLVGHHLIQPHAIERREQDWISGSRPSEMRTSHVREPREMSCPAFRAISTPPARNWAHRSHTSAVETTIYWDFERMLLIEESQQPNTWLS
jgi:hypothetical protein